MSKKKLNLGDIQPLPEHLRKQVYGDDYDNTWKLRYSGLSDSEKRTLSTFLKYQEAKEVYWVPEVNCPKGKHSPDLLIDGVKVEIKEVTTLSSISHQVKKSSAQINTTGLLLMDASGSELVDKSIYHRALMEATQYSIKSFVIVSNDRLLSYSIKKGDSATANHQAHDPKSPYVSILPNSGQKVKPLNELFSNKDGATELSAPLKPRKRTNAYWQRRVEHTYLESEKAADAYRKRVSRVYADAQKTCLVELKQLYEDCWSKQAGFDRAKLRQVVNAKTMADFRRKLIEANLQNSLPPEYSGRVTRLQLLDAQLWYAAHKAGLDQTDIVTASSAKTYEDAYYKTAYNIATGTGLMPAFTTLDTDAINAVLSEKFSGKSYSERIWTNSDLLAKQLSTKLASAIATGQSIDKTAKDFRDRFGVSRYYAERLIRTETNHFYNQAASDSYKAMGIDKYKFIATLDSRTSEICAYMDGKIIEVDKGAVGVNIPPLHPNCRSTIAPYLGKDLDALVNSRAYHDPDTDKTEYCDNMTYDEWRKWVDLEPEPPEDVVTKVKHTKHIPVVDENGKPIANYGITPLEPQGGTPTLNDLIQFYYSKSRHHIDYNPVCELEKPLTSNEIVKKIAGGDKTVPGSCASVALAYVANRLGLDVLDYRGGESMMYFADRTGKVDFFRSLGMNMLAERNLNDFAAVKRLLKRVDEDKNKEYMLMTGRHASIVRNSSEYGWQYLELQSPYFNGYKRLTLERLKNRFDCKTYNSKCHGNVGSSSFLVPLDSFADSITFREYMGYINTKKYSQMKGKSGVIR